MESRTISAAIESAQDVDYFVLCLDRRSIVTVDVSALDDTVSIEFLDPNGNAIQPYGKWASKQRPGRFTVTVTPSGAGAERAYVGLRQYANFFGRSRYRLRVGTNRSFVQRIPTEPEPSGG